MEELLSRNSLRLARYLFGRISESRRTNAVAPEPAARLATLIGGSAARLKRIAENVRGVKMPTAALRSHRMPRYLCHRPSIRFPLAHRSPSCHRDSAKWTAEIRRENADAPRGRVIATLVTSAPSFDNISLASNP